MGDGEKGLGYVISFVVDGNYLKLDNGDIAQHLNGSNGNFYVIWILSHLKIGGENRYRNTEKVKQETFIQEREERNVK